MAEQGYHDYKCKNCGGPLIFKGDVNKMVCEFCDSQFDMSEFKDDERVREETSDWSQTAGATMAAGEAGMNEYACNTCGAVMVAEENVGATECPYCGNPLVIKDTFEGMNLPDGLIPFAVDKKSAQDALKNYYSGKKLLPKGFIDNNRMDNINGVYVPFWLFDCDVEGSVFYKATKERKYNKGQEEWKEIKDFAVSRAAGMKFEKVPADGAKEMNDAYMDSLEPYDYSKITAYNAAYMSGYVASKYDEDANAVKGRVDDRIRTTAKAEIRKTVEGYDSVSEQASDIDIKNGKISYCMIPVWMLTTRYNGEAYTFAMNGQTGKVTGDLPVDKGQATGYFAKVAGIAFVIFQVLMFLLKLFQNNNVVGIEIAALVVALIIGAIALSSAKSSMVSHQKHEAAQYLKQGSFKLNRKEDRHTGTRNELVRKAPEQNAGAK